MANVKTSEKEWKIAREYFEAGLTLSQIVVKTGISKTQLSKRSNSDGWARGTEKEQLISDAVRVAVAKGTLTEHALSVHKEIVDERTKHVMFFNSSAVQNVREAMALECGSQFEFKARAETILKGKEAVLGKTPDTAIQINNAPAETPKLNIVLHK